VAVVEVRHRQTVVVAAVLDHRVVVVVVLDRQVGWKEVEVEVDHQWEEEVDHQWEEEEEEDHQ